MIFLLLLEQNKFKITDTKLYVPVVTLSVENNVKLFQKLQSGFKGTINWNKYQSTLTEQARNRYLDSLIDPGFQGVNGLFVLPFENKTDRNVHTGYFFPKVEMKDYNVVIDERNFFDQPTKIDKKTHDNIRKIANGQVDDYKTGCLLDHVYFKENYKLIAIDLNKQ